MVWFRFDVYSMNLGSAIHCVFNIYRYVNNSFYLVFTTENP